MKKFGLPVLLLATFWVGAQVGARRSDAALGFDRVRNTAQSIAGICGETANLLAKIEQTLAYSEHQAIEWDAESTPAYITEDASGNLAGEQYSRQAVANALFSLDQVRRALRNETTTKGDHVGNLNQLAYPPQNNP